MPAYRSETTPATAISFVVQDDDASLLPKSFDGAVQLAALICDTSMAAIALLTREGSAIRSTFGTDSVESEVEQELRGHVIATNDLLVVSNVMDDERFGHYAFITGDVSIRFYAGIPLLLADTTCVGVLSVMAAVPKQLSEKECSGLRLLAHQIVDLLVGQVQDIPYLDKFEEIKAEHLLGSEPVLAGLMDVSTERRLVGALLDSLQEGIVVCDETGCLTVFNGAATRLHGVPNQHLTPDQWAEYYNLYSSDGLTPMALADIPLYRALHGEEVKDCEMVIVPPLGNSKRLLTSANPINDENGVTVGALTAMHDITDRHEVELDRSRLAAIVESSDEAILASTLDGLIVVWNKAAERMFGYSAADIVGRHASVLASPKAEYFIPYITARMFNGEHIDAVEATHVCRNGQPIEVSISFSPIKDGSDQMIGLSCFFRDNSEKKKAEAALAESEERLRRFSDASFEGIAITRDELLLDVNGAYASMFGYDNAAEMIGLHVSQIASEESRDEVVQNVVSGNPAPYEAKLLRRNGTTFTAEIRGRTTQIGEQPTRITAVRDISIRKLMEDELRSREAALRALLESAPIILYTTDVEGKITVIEGRHLEEFGTDAATIVGSSIFEFIGSPDVNSFLQLALNGVEIEFDFAYKGISFHSKVRPIVDGEGKLAGIVGVAFDISERVRTEERFRDYNIVLEMQKQELEKANAELGRLATTDGLTGLQNHRAIQERLASEAELATRHNLPLSAILLDVDLFKDYNDSYGHPAGDLVLKQVARVLSSCVREADTVGRYGGEEFLVLLPQTDLIGATELAERIRVEIERAPWLKRKVTASFGIATYEVGFETAGDLIGRADDALYRSKESGRNCLSVSETPTIAARLA
jgi:diguanylate cyclase (GGDEF)-like protein/PAS domain S-box-containing protein